jgi:hypothetical protein
MTAATSLLDFILNLLRDPQAQAEFRASPEHVLAANGLTGVSAADIHETLPLVTDNRFVELTNSSHAVSPSVVPTAGDRGIHTAIQYLYHITCTYRYDDHRAHVHDLGHGNIWAVGDGAQTFDDSHMVTGGPVPGPVTPGPGGDPAGSSPSSAFRHPGHHHGDGLHSFGSGAATTPAGSTGSPTAYSGDIVGWHDGIGFRPANPGGVSLAGPDDHHTHDAHSSLGDSYYGQESYHGHDSYYGHDSDHGAYDNQESHIYLDLH